MARQPRLEFEGAIYHVTARGNARHEIFVDEADRKTFLDLLEREAHQQRWLCYAFLEQMERLAQREHLDNVPSPKPTQMMRLQSSMRTTT